MDIEKIKTILSTVEQDTKDLDILKDEIINKYSKPLDNVIKKIQDKNVLMDGDVSIDDLVLSIQEICPHLYFVAAGMERIGISSDAAEKLRLEVFNKARESTVGAQGDKTAFAETQSSNEQMITNLYKRSYKELQRRLDLGIATLDALKKALSVKSQEMSVMGTQTRVSQQMNN